MLIKIKKYFNHWIDKAKYGFKNNKVTVILGLCTIIPVIISLNLFDGNPIIGLAIVPIFYRLICRLILWIMKKRGSNESTDFFNTLSRMSILVSFFLLALLSTILGYEKMGFIEIILLSLFVAYFDKVLVLIFSSIFGTMLGSVGLGSSTNSVTDLMDNTSTVFDHSDGTKIYKDSSGKVIGKSSYNATTGETTYWNEKLEYIGKSEKNSNGNEKYWDSKLNYKGQSEKNNNGYTSYYDEKLNYKGKSRENSNGTSSHFKK